jgi:hypothetical protein
MVLRHRDADGRALISGTYTSPIGPTTFLRFKTDGLRRICDDTWKNWPYTQNDLSISESTQFYPTLTCSGNNRQWADCPVGYQPAVPDPRTYYPALTALDRNNFAWEILAKTNPSVPYVSVPTMVGELKDLPSLFGLKFGTLMDLGGPSFHRFGRPGYLFEKGADAFRNAIKNPRFFARNLGNIHLIQRWAIAPFLSDLLKLCNFVKAVDNRTTELMRLRTGATIRKRVQLGTVVGSAAPQVNLIVHSEGCTVRGTFQVHHAKKAWGTAQWKLLPDAELPSLGYGPLRELARNLTFGLKDREALAMAWELCPWSWLADWLGNTGDLIAATNNSVGCTWHNVCYMRTSAATLTCTYLTPGSDGFALTGLNNQSYVLRMVRKERYVCVPVLPVPFPQLPILTGRHWSILASLAAQRL